MPASETEYSARPLSADTWGAFARLVEANNGVWGGCWCMGFRNEGFGPSPNAEGNRAAKEALVRAGAVRQILVFAGTDALGWCQFGVPAELDNIKNPKTCDKGLTELPDWRIG